MRKLFLPRGVIAEPLAALTLKANERIARQAEQQVPVRQRCKRSPWKAVISLLILPPW